MTEVMHITFPISDGEITYIIKGVESVFGDEFTRYEVYQKCATGALVHRPSKTANHLEAPLTSLEDAEKFVHQLIKKDFLAPSRRLEKTYEN